MSLTREQYLAVLAVVVAFALWCSPKNSRWIAIIATSIAVAIVLMFALPGAPGAPNESPRPSAAATPMQPLADPTSGSASPGSRGVAAAQPESPAPELPPTPTTGLTSPEPAELVTPPETPRAGPEPLVPVVVIETPQVEVTPTSFAEPAVTVTPPPCAYSAPSIDVPEVAALFKPVMHGTWVRVRATLDAEGRATVVETDRGPGVPEQIVLAVAARVAGARWRPTADCGPPWPPDVLVIMRWPE